MPARLTRTRLLKSQLPVKLATPFTQNLDADLNNSTAGANISAGNWTAIAARYRHLHYEGHAWAKTRDTDGTFQGQKLRTADPAKRNSIYINGSYTTQGSAHFELRWAAHLERNYPLAIARLRTSTGMTLNAGINATTTTLTVVLPTSRPAGMPANHPNGTPSTLWPVIASMLTPAVDAYSRNTAEYVSTLRVDDELIGLPVYSGGAYVESAGVLTITGCVRGMWGTTAATHSSAAIVFPPVYIGSAGAVPNDAGLSGNPEQHSTSAPIRYGVAFWDYARGALHNGIAYIADLARAELAGLDFDTAGTILTVSSVSGSTFTSTGHGFTDNTLVMLYGYDIPTGITSFQPYFIVNALTNTFQVSLTQGGAAVNPQTTNAGNLKVSRIWLTAPAASADTTWWDVTSLSAYNNGDGYANDLGQETTLNDLPWDFTNGTSATPWLTRQNNKRAAVQSKLSDYGYPDLYMYANNYMAQSSSFGNRLDAMADAVWDGYILEHALHGSGEMLYETNQLMQIMAGKDGAGTVTDPAGLRGIFWAKAYDWSSSVDSDATLDRYLRRCYAAWLMAWRPAATNPAFLGNVFGSTLVTRPSDRAGHEIFYWDWGTPTSPVAPETVSDLTRPIGGVDFFRRDYTKGTVLVNFTSTSRQFTTGAIYYDALTETSGNGALTRLSVGSTVTVPAYDAAFLLIPV
jgi:hypothetical protein